MAGPVPRRHGPGARAALRPEGRRRSGGSTSGPRRCSPARTSTRRRRARRSADWCETWLDGYGTRRPSTVRQARVHVAQIVAEFGALPLAAVRPSQVRAWCTKLGEQGYATSTVYALHARLSQIMSDAVHDGIVPRSPCSRRTSPPRAKQRPYVATTEQVWALHDAMPERAAPGDPARRVRRAAGRGGVRAAGRGRRLHARASSRRPCSTRPSR